MSTWVGLMHSMGRSMAFPATLLAVFSIVPMSFYVFKFWDRKMEEERLKITILKHKIEMEDLKHAKETRA